MIQRNKETFFAVLQLIISIIVLIIGLLLFPISILILVIGLVFCAYSIRDIIKLIKKRK